jgi:hypothetical protein
MQQNKGRKRKGQEASMHTHSAPWFLFFFGEKDLLLPKNGRVEEHPSSINSSILHQSIDPSFVHCSTCCLFYRAASKDYKQYSM